MYGYDLYYKAGNHKALISFHAKVLPTEAAAVEKINEAIRWYIQRAFFGASQSDFEYKLIEYKP